MSHINNNRSAIHEIFAWSSSLHDWARDALRIRVGYWAQNNQAGLSCQHYELHSDLYEEQISMESKPSLYGTG